MDLIDKDILKIMMTMDFDSQNFSNEYLKELLVKFRYYYRVLDGKCSSKDMEISSMEKMVEKYKYLNSNLEKDNEHLIIKYNKLKSKKITFKDYLKSRKKHK